MPENYNELEMLNRRLEALKEKLTAPQAKPLNLALLARVVKRASEFAATCAECRECLGVLQAQIAKLEETSGVLAKAELKIYHAAVNRCVAHLQKGHKLLTEGYYMSLYMSIGLSLGVAFGASLGNIGMGLPIGLAMGVAIGAGMDADAKSKGKVI